MDRLFRTRENRVIAGVAGGLARFFDVDVVLVRLLWVLAAFAGGSGVLAYIIAWIVIPDQKKVSLRTGDGLGKEDGGQVEQPEFTEENERGLTTEEQVRGRRRRNAGLILVGIGLFFLARQALPRVIWAYSWPILFIVIGLTFLLKDRKGEER